jgi:hypothetical protein
MESAIITIPDMIDPLGKCWDQPERSELTMQSDRVLMTEQTLNKLKEYSSSIPSGKYIGKMWKRKNNEDWMLCWYGENENPELLSINKLKIKIVWK